MSTRWWVAALVVTGVASGLGGCCADAGRCPQNAVAVHVSVAEAPPAGVTVEGAGATWTCTELDAETLCAPDTIADGVHAIVVTVEGEPPLERELLVRTFAPPPYSCDCRLRRGELAVALEGAPPAPDAGAATEDAGAEPDAG